ncbi:MAG TPA: hypothetical protein VG603_12565, partial [Chitinophagales bacterium]|nr:hypothetical protein [Chitinophagales bacterium]
MCVLCSIARMAMAGPQPAVPEVNILAEQQQALEQRITAEKQRIAKDYQRADDRLFNLVDSIVDFINKQPVSAAQRNLYL